MESHTGLLHVAHNTINNNERLCVGIQRIKTTDEQGGTITRTSRTIDGMDVSTKGVFNLVFNSRRSSIIDFCDRCSQHIGAILIHGTELVGNHGNIEVSTLPNAHLLTKILGGVNKERRGKSGYTDGKFALCIGHGGETVVVECLHLHTGKRSLGGGINDNTLHFLHGILRLLLDRSGLLDNSFLLGAFCIDHLIIILRIGGRNAQCQKYADR